MSARRLIPWSLLIFAMVFPSLVTWCYFVALAGSPASLQRTAYAAGKIIQFALPVACTILILGERPRWKPPNRRGLGAGLVFGAVILGAMLALYHGLLKPMGAFEEPAESIRQKVQDLGLDAFWKYAAVGIFYALCHSALEEYYWRWFVFERLADRMPVLRAIALSSLAFMAHHVILMATYFGWLSPWTWVLSLAVAVGGAFWAWLYHASRSLYGPWLSHLLVDAGIFVVGFDLARPVLGA